MRVVGRQITRDFGTPMRNPHGTKPSPSHLQATNAVGLVYEILPIAQRGFGVLVDSNDDRLDARARSGRDIVLDELLTPGAAGTI